MKLIQLKNKDIPRIRKKILGIQNGVCAICQCTPQRPCLDHHHVKKIKGTGRVRGVLCSNCNVLLAKMENNCVRYGIKLERLPFILEQMAKYLSKKQYKYIHPSEAPKPRKLKKSSYNKLLKKIGHKYKIPPYPKRQILTKRLKELFEKAGIEPEFYKERK